MNPRSEDPFAELAEQLRVLDAFERDRVVHWADPIFRGMYLERKVMTSLVSEAAARRMQDDRDLAQGVLVVDLHSCGGSIGAVAVIRDVVKDAREVSYVGFKTPPRGRRRLLQRGLSDLSVRRPGPPVRTAFHAGSLFDLRGMDDLWSQLSLRYGWIVALGFDGGVGRRGLAPVQPDDMRALSPSDTALISLLDPDVLAAQHGLLALMATSLDQPLRIYFETLDDARLRAAGEVIIEPGYDLEGSRRELMELLESVKVSARRARLRPMGSLRKSGEVLEYDSPGLVEQYLMAHLDVSRSVPAGAIRAFVVDRLDVDPHVV